MPDTIDSLQIEINAKASKANDAIDRLVGKLDRLTTSLSRVNGTNLNGLANGVQRLGNAMQVMNNVSTADFTRLATNLTKLGTINVSALNSAASSMSHLTRAFNSLGTVSANAQAVGEMARNIARLGNKSVQTAIANLPQLAKAMNNLMATLSRAPRVSQNVIQMTNALANLTSQGSKVGSASNSIVRGLNKTTTATKKASSGFKGLASYIGRFYATYFMVIRGMKQLWSSIESTADYIEAYNYFNVALGKIGSDWSYQFEQYGYDNAESYAESFSTRLSESLGKLSGLKMEIGADGQGILSESGMKNLGLNIQEITQYASQLASVTNSVGQTGEVSLAAASSFTKLAGDISSLFNVDYSSVSKNLQSGLIGQSRALYKYGIDITNATLQTYAYNLGLSKSVSEMTQAEKMQLRMIAILDQSKVSWGDLANTINSPSNMIRQFTNNLKETGMVLGQLFIPVFQKVLPVINGATIALKRLLVNIAGFLGVEIDLDSFGQGYTDMEDDVDGTTDSYEDATKAVEEYKNQLLGFDEVNKLSEPTDVSDSTGALQDTIDLTDEIIAATEKYEKVWNAAYEQMENKAQEFADYLYSFFKPFEMIAVDIKLGDFFSLGKDISGLITNIFDYLIEVIDNIEWNKIGTYFGRFVDGFIKGSFESLPKSATLITKSAKGVLVFLTSAVKAIKWDDLAPKFLDGIAGFFDNLDISEIFENITKFVNSITDAISTVINSIISNPGKLLDVIASFAEFIFELIISSTTSIITTGINLWKNLLGTLANFVKTLLGFNEDEDEQEIIPTISEDVRQFKADMETFVESIEKGKEARANSFENAVSENAYLEELANKYLALAGKASLTNDELALMQTYKDELIEQNPDFAKILNNDKLSYEEQKKAIENVIKQLRKQIYIEAAKEKLVEIAKQKLEKEKELAESSDTLSEKADALSAAETRLSRIDSQIIAKQNELNKYWDNSTNTFMPEYMDKVNSISYELENLKEKQKDANTEVVNAKANLEEATSAYDEAKNSVNDLSNEWDMYADVAAGVTTSITTNSQTMATTVGNAFYGMKKNIGNSVYSAKNSIKNLQGAFANFTISGGFKKGKEFAEEIARGIAETLNKTNYRVSGPIGTIMQLNGKMKLPGITAYATGGFPEDGLFLANHEELVGKFSNGKTAVANNIQITDGIEEASYRGMMRALSEYQSGNTNVNVTLQGDADGLFKVVQNKANNYTTQTGRPAFLI